MVTEPPKYTFGSIKKPGWGGRRWGGRGPNADRRGGWKKPQMRNVTAREWMEGEESDEDTEVEDLNDQLFRLIESTP